MYGGWEVDGDEKSSIVKVWWEIKPKPQWMSIIIISILSSNADNDFPKIIHNMAMQNYNPSTKNERKLKSPPALIAKLVPRPVSYTHLDVYKRQVSCLHGVCLTQALM